MTLGQYQDIIAGEEINSSSVGNVHMPQGHEVL